MLDSHLLCECKSFLSCWIIALYENVHTHFECWWNYCVMQHQWTFLFMMRNLTNWTITCSASFVYLNLEKEIRTTNHYRITAFYYCTELSLYLYDKVMWNNRRTFKVNVLFLDCKTTCVERQQEYTGKWWRRHPHMKVRWTVWKDWVERQLAAMTDGCQWNNKPIRLKEDPLNPPFLEHELWTSADDANKEVQLSHTAWNTFSVLTPAFLYQYQYIIKLHT